MGVVVQAGDNAEASNLLAEAIGLLAAAMAAADDPPMARINGPGPETARLAAEYEGVSNRPATNTGATRLMEVSRVSRPTAPTGARRLARPDDLDLMVDWLGTFDGETGGQTDEGFNRALTAAYIERSELHVWDAGQGPVASTAVFAPDPAVSRLVFVYTPVGHRRRGFASRLVAEVADDVLDTGARCILFADLANPTSTGIYERVGFRPVADFVRYEFA